jgi:hypothetical protein
MAKGFYFVRVTQYRLSYKRTFKIENVNDILMKTIQKFSFTVFLLMLVGGSGSAPSRRLQACITRPVARDSYGRNCTTGK